ncbi:MAG TPA: CDP-diacylglycerol--glycerol-3-phosphate 3-phosphatidyltransferase [Candidatus Omnitrophota bacterium]|nr:CDP-diacylglycerol--glycerol-3-phosphate 3-phosphatidyltransferase [Candidatus Omnitrophota bacterium]HPD85071.1 CDP-diacylglycerol--glycerol-3-phosphate 3-phosphatidyltransferase [Candidatus Omnitrophota bacterium]HRZ03929.1 CDP-diacylglycerol--glycerol-3-phosphate 3-phosphatidyltransferase [Candidatus Omnitrophota bacterium]
MNLPNKLTISRFILTFVFVFLISQNGLVPVVAAAIVFILASLTDYYDGYLAKKYNMVSDFGRLMDPIADKFLILAAFLAFVRMHLVDDWMVVLILGREIVVTGLRVFALTKGKVLAAEKAGKHKTISQIVAIFSILGFIVFREVLTSLSQWSGQIEMWWRTGIQVLMLITLVLTLTSGIYYLWNNRKLIYAQ